MAAQNRPKWEQDQITSFTAWSNFRWAESLKARGRPVVPLITDINEDFKYVRIIDRYEINDLRNLERE